MKIEQGKAYRRRDGAKVAQERPRDGGVIPWKGSDEIWRYDDGRCCDQRKTLIDFIAEWPDEDDTPKTWGEMTDAEKGALLLAHYESPGSVEFLNVDHWVTLKGLGWLDEYAYRIKPEPKRETVTLYAGGSFGWNPWRSGSLDKYCIIYETEGGKPILNSIRMEDLK